MKLKICGMKYQNNITEVAALQPDYLGFIFYDKSARNFDTSIPEISNSIKKTGVFVNEDMDSVIEKIETFNLQAVQLHGEESPNYCAELKFELHLKREHWREKIWEPYKNRQDVEYLPEIEIIKVFSIKNEFNFEVLKPYEAVCDYFLFDTKGKLPGGNGYTFDWSVLNHYPSTKPFFLSGGIGLDQIEDIKKFKQSKASKYCYALDVNSKFEIEPGLKNIKKLEGFKKSLSFRT